VTAIAGEAWGDFMHALIALEEEINGEEEKEQRNKYTGSGSCISSSQPSDSP